MVYGGTDVAVIGFHDILPRPAGVVAQTFGLPDDLDVHFPTDSYKPDVK
jgi:hypothetical protein